MAWSVKTVSTDGREYVADDVLPRTVRVAPSSRRSRRSTGRPPRKALLHLAIGCPDLLHCDLRTPRMPITIDRFEKFLTGSAWEEAPFEDSSATPFAQMQQGLRRPRGPRRMVRFVRLIQRRVRAVLRTFRPCHLRRQSQQPQPTPQGEYCG
jgi:hypothetical protein